MCEPRRPGLVGPPGFHTTAREPKCAHFRVLAFKNTTTKFHERTPRERKKKENCGGRREKKRAEILGGPAEGCPAEGCPAEGCPAEGCPAEGCPAEGGFTGGRVQRKGPSEMGWWGFGFSAGFWGRKQKLHRNKMKREMSKDKKKVKKSKEREKKQSKHHLFDFGQLISTSANFDFGQFSTSANFDFGQFDFGQLAEVELSEVELAEVEHPLRDTSGSFD